MTATWSFINSPELNGKVAVITGANSGLGFETARALRQKGATVVMACRSEDKAQAAIAKLETSAMGPAPEFVQLDLEDLASVARAAATITEAHPAVDFLINNAGVMGLKGPDGPQRQLNANYLGHVALTAALLPAVEKAGGRIVMLSSNLHRRGKLNKETPLDLSKQSPAIAYGSTKLADLLFCFEGDRRLRATRSAASIRAAHPGWSRSELASKGPVEGRGAFMKKTAALIGSNLGQKTERGALPTLRAALDPSIPSGSYVGPAGFMEMWGEPKTVGASKLANDQELGKAVFDAGLAAVGATWPDSDS
jgi:hypothetical protein